MFKKEERAGLIVYLYYNRDSKKLQNYGDIVYHSKKHRFVQLYTGKEELDALKQKLSKEKFVKRIRLCHIQDLDTDFVGSLYREQENAVTKKSDLEG